MKISLATQFQNELEFLPGFFKHALTYADEVICAAHAPTDGSLEFVKELATSQTIPIKILEFPSDAVHDNGFSYMKNAVLEQCTGDWIVNLDSDEEMHILRSDFENESFLAISTQTMHLSTDLKQPQWTLDDRQKIIDEAPWLKQRHWRIIRNGLGIRWMGLIHEELRLPGGVFLRNVTHDTDIKMFHFGAWANPAKRSFKDGLYAELLLRAVERPECRKGTNPWWWTKYFTDNRDKLYAEREEYRKQRDSVNV